MSPGETSIGTTLQPTESGETTHRCFKLLSVKAIYFVGIVELGYISICRQWQKRCEIPQRETCGIGLESTDRIVNGRWKVLETHCRK